MAEGLDVLEDIDTEDKPVDAAIDDVDPAIIELIAALVKEGYSEDEIVAAILEAEDSGDSSSEPGTMVDGGSIDAQSTFAKDVADEFEGDFDAVYEALEAEFPELSADQVHELTEQATSGYEPDDSDDEDKKDDKAFDDGGYVGQRGSGNARASAQEAAGSRVQAFQNKATRKSQDHSGSAAAAISSQNVESPAVQDQEDMDAHAHANQRARADQATKKKDWEPEYSSGGYVEKPKNRLASLIGSLGRYN